eukprot:g9349.t1
MERAADRRVAVREKRGIEVLEFFGENADIDLPTLQDALRNLALNNSGAAGGAGPTIIIAGNVDARNLAFLAEAVAKLRFTSPELEDFTHALAATVKARENAFSPRYLSQIALALSARKVQDVHLIEFVRQETLKVVQDVEPAHANALLEAFRRWGFFDRQMHDMIVERMTDEVDRFSSRDIVDALKVLSDLGLVRGFLLRRLAQLAFENLHVFTPKQLVGITYSLARLRFLVKMNMEHTLSAADTSKLFFSLAMLQPEFDDADLVRELASRFLDAHRKQVVYMIHLVDACWAVCRFKHLFDGSTTTTTTTSASQSRDVEPYGERVQDLFQRLFASPVPRNRVLLAKAFEVVNSLQHEDWDMMLKKPVVPSREWVTACDETDSVAQSKNESSRLQAELLMKMDHTFHREKLQLQQNMSLNMQAGSGSGGVGGGGAAAAAPIGFRADLVDEKLRLVVDLDAPNRPVSRAVKHRILAQKGFHPVSLNYWRWRQCKSDEDHAELLEKAVGAIIATLKQGGSTPA